MTKVPVLFTLYFSSLLSSSHAHAQEKRAVLYRDSIFTAVNLQKDLYYGVSSNGERESKAYRYDLYMPAGEGSHPLGFSGGRPLIIWIHGGGFKFGSRRAAGIRLWCNSFARRGYLCAAINYRLSGKNTLGNFKKLVEGCYDAVEDARAAVVFFKTHYQVLGIDTSRIILAGNSAGGMIALQAAYSTPSELLQLTGKPLPASLSSHPGPGGIAAVINFWGALFEADWLANARIPIVSVHGGRDGIVVPGRKGEYLFGSAAIHAKADSLSIPNRVWIYEGYSHELQKHFNPFFVSRATKGRWQEAGQFAADFLYEELFR